MNRNRPFQAVIADMDGVLTQTATLHERAWKRLFDDFLREREGQQPFSGNDYRAHVDGKPRYDGVADFLSSRGIQLPQGNPDDAPSRETIFGLGNRKNQIFLAILDQVGVTVFDDAVAAIERWRRGNLKLAVVSSSRNCRRVLRAADLARRVDTIVDGQLANELGLQGKPAIMREAARRLGVEPADAVVLEDSTAGVAAGRQEGFGWVVGIGRNDNDHGLFDAGAHTVSHSVYDVRFDRWVPSALDRLAELSNWQNHRPLAVFLDFDGTLSPIVDDPSAAFMPDALRQAVHALAQRCPVAIVSGRDRDDVASRVGLEALAYAGNHGVDIAAPGHRKTLPQVERAIPDVQRAEAELERRVRDLPGVLIERKRFSVAAHYRQARSEDVVAQLVRVVESIAQHTGLRMRKGEKVLELEPPVDWNKGRALAWLIDVLPDVKPGESFILYIGDGETDEDAFNALQDLGAGIHVGTAISDTLAHYHLKDTNEVLELLGWLAAQSKDGAEWHRRNED